MAHPFRLVLVAHLVDGEDRGWNGRAVRIGLWRCCDDRSLEVVVCGDHQLNEVARHRRDEEVPGRNDSGLQVRATQIQVGRRIGNVGAVLREPDRDGMGLVVCFAKLNRECNVVDTSRRERDSSGFGAQVVGYRDSA